LGSESDTQHSNDEHSLTTVVLLMYMR